MSNYIKPSQHPALNIMETLWMEGKRATEIAQYLDSKGHPPVNVKALAKYGQRKWNSKLRLVVEDKRPGELSELVQELEDQGLKVNKIGISKRNSFVWEKDEEGINRQVPKELVTESIEVVPNLEFELERSFLPTIKVACNSSTSRSKPRNMKLAVSLPDMQIGYYRDNQGALTTYHDEAALDVAHQLLVYLEENHGVDLVVNQGDNMDLPMFSTYRSSPHIKNTTQLTIDRAGTEVAIQREICKNSKNVWLSGNHEERLTKTLIDKAPELVGVARSNSTEPLLSVPYLLRFDEYNTEYVEGYPNGAYWANEKLKFIHGSTVSGAGTAAKHLGTGISVVYGHHHHQALLYDTFKTQSGGYTYFAGSAGCLCRTDGQVPSGSVGVNASGRVSSKPKTNNWQQGIFVIWYNKDGTESYVEPVLIEEGKAIFRGLEFTAKVDANGNELI